jgi:hypothetical protein
MQSANEGPTKTGSRHFALLELAMIWKIFRHPSAVWQEIPEHQRNRLKRLHAILTAVLAAFFLFSERVEEVTKWFVPTGCHYRSVSDGAEDTSRPRRHCLSGSLAYVQWGDDSPYPGRPKESYTIPNRAIQVESAEVGRPPIWREYEVITMRGKTPVWSGPGFVYTAIPGGEHLPLGCAPEMYAANMQTGFLLRRTQIIEDKCDANSLGSVEFLELLVPNQKTEGGQLSKLPICFRKISLRCGEELGASPRMGGQFHVMGTVTAVGTDP